MNKILITTFCALNIFSLFSMEQEASRENKISYLKSLLENAEKTYRFRATPDSKKRTRKLQKLAEERVNNNIEILEYTEKRKFFLQEIPWNFFGFCWKKQVNTIECLLGGWDISSDFCLSTDSESSMIGEKPGDDDRPLKELIAESTEGWNVYFKRKTVYCLKTKLLGSTAITLGIASLWYYTKSYISQS